MTEVLIIQQGRGGSITTIARGVPEHEAYQHVYRDGEYEYSLLKFVKLATVAIPAPRLEH